jgi:peptidoglycan/xylan/chitin deacetylase (PgdA/CDA1 family)
MIPYHTPRIVMRLIPSLLWKIPTTEKKLYLTFDDGPAEATPALLQFLDELEITATFFVLGERAEQYREFMSELAKRSHLIGSHSFSHTRMLFRSTRRIENEITRTDALLMSLGIPRPQYFRPPYGVVTPALLKVARELSKTVVLWTFNSHDYAASFDAARVLARAQRRIQPGSILLFHETHNHTQTINCLQQLIPLLKAEEYTFAALPT